MSFTTALLKLFDQVPCKILISLSEKTLLELGIYFDFVVNNSSINIHFHLRLKLHTFSGSILNISSTSFGKGIYHKLTKTFPSSVSKACGRSWNVLKTRRNSVVMLPVLYFGNVVCSWGCSLQLLIIASM